ncbi:MAG: hypothetical protein WDA11_08225, partial [Thiohalomonadaceae bacterium]
LERLDAFASRFGAEFYGLFRNRSTITLEKVEWEVPASYPMGDSTVVPLRAGERMGWRLVE